MNGTLFSPIGGMCLAAKEPIAKPKRLLAPCDKPVAKLRSAASSTLTVVGVSAILLMVQKSGDHQLRLVVYPIYPIIYRF